ncbi:MAG: TonB family protein [Opitutaceae bacterium]
MSLRKNQAFWTSVILHVVVLFALLLGIIIETFEPEEELHVFQVVELPTQNAVAPPAPPVELPQPTQPQELDLPDIPDLAPIPEPTPPAPVPTPVKPKPVPVPTPQPQKTVEPQMTKEQFDRLNPPKEVKPRPATPRPRAPSNIKIDPGKFDVPDIFIPSPSSQNMSQRELDAMSRYVAQISAMLNRAWVKPGSLAGRDLKVVAIFYVDASGRISNIRFQSASGNASFDTSVKAAFEKIRSAGPTPTGKGQDIRVSFNMLD